MTERERQEDRALKCIGLGLIVIGMLVQWLWPTPHEIHPVAFVAWLFAFITLMASGGEGDGWGG